MQTQQPPSHPTVRRILLWVTAAITAGALLLLPTVQPVDGTRQTEVTIDSITARRLVMPRLVTPAMPSVRGIVP